MAREKALFHGHPVAAVAATSEAIAAEACKLIKVDYEVLPHVIEIEDAIKPDAPILHDFIKFDGKPSNIAGRLEHKLGDVDKGFRGRRCRDRTLVQDAARASRLHRAARLSRQRRRRRQDDDLVVEPGPVHGPGDDGAADGAVAERDPRHSCRDRRRLRRQDDRLPRTARHHAVEEVGPAGEDGHDAR